MLLCIYAIVNLLKVERGNPVEEAFPLFFCDGINKAPPQKKCPAWFKSTYYSLGA